MDADPLPLLFLLVLPWSIIGGIALLGLLLIAAALISGSEVAYFSLTGNQLHQLEADGSLAGRRVLHLKEKPRRLLATILIANSLINIGIVLVAYILFRYFLPAEVLLHWGQSAHAVPILNWLDPWQWATFLGFFISIIGTTFLLIMFSEAVPKIYANLHSVTFAKRMSRPLKIMMTLFSPLNLTLVKWGQWLEKKLSHDNALGASKDDIDKAIDLAVASDKDSEVEAEILKSIVTFNDVSVRQIMRSRMDIIAVDTMMTEEEVLAMVREAGYSRLPVYEEQLDNIKGILYAKDLIGFLLLDASDRSWTSLIRPEVLYVPEARKINELLKDFQREHLHMAIVVDEYGGTSGIVTMEDVIEEVIGEIHDEFDEDQELHYRRLSDHEFIFEGRTMLIDVARVMDIEKDSFDNTNADSLAGLVLELNGKMPVVGQKVLLPPFSFTVLSVSPKRIERIKVQMDT